MDLSDNGSVEISFGIAFALFGASLYAFPLHGEPDLLASGALLAAGVLLTLQSFRLRKAWNAKIRKQAEKC